MVNSEEIKSEINFKELLEKLAKDLEEIAVELYNKHDFGSVERLCEILLEIYENIESINDVKRMKLIMQKIALVDEYYDATFGLLKRQMESRDEEIQEEESKKE